MCVVEMDMKKTLVALGSMLASTQLAHVLRPSRKATQASSSSYPSSPNAPHLLWKKLAMVKLVFAGGSLACNLRRINGRAERRRGGSITHTVLILPPLIHQT